VQFVIAVTGKYLTEVDLDGRPRGSRIIMRVVGSYGYAARGVILAVLGQRLIRAGIDHSPGTAADTDTAFDVIGGPGFGDVAFFFVAIGTISYGLFMYATAKYYQFREDD